jgi:hypothetical protein
MARITPIKPPDRRSVFVILAIAGAISVAGCSQNPPRISPTTAKSGGAAASISPATASGAPAAAAIRPAAKDASTACPTEGVGGDDLPPLCAPSPSRSGQPSMTGPASPTPAVSALSPTCQPSAESVSPSRPGAEIGGDVVSIMGAGFIAGVQVFFGGTSAEALTVRSGTEIVACPR